jgi:hypothetical protein
VTYRFLFGMFALLTHRLTSLSSVASIIYYDFDYYYFNYFRIASKGNNNTDEPGAFPAREWLRQRCVGKSVTFETRYVILLKIQKKSFWFFFSQNASFFHFNRDASMTLCQLTTWCTYHINNYIHTLRLSFL